MHLTIDRLLTLRDSNPADVAHLEHLRVCAECSQALATLRAQRTALQSLSDIDPPADSWAKIQAAMLEEKRVAKSMSQHKYRATYRVTAIAASVALVAITATILLRQSHLPTAESQQVLVAGTLPQSMINLVTQSQELESLLYDLPQRPHVEQADTAATLDELEARIQLLDVQLSSVDGSAAGIALHQQSEQLWRQRVELMASLVNVRYAQASRFDL